ncbi:MAG: hypothetical protein ABJZ55_23735 [Fuerstiella sp.]
MIPRTKHKIAVAIATSLSISGCLPAIRFRPSSATSTVQRDHTAQRDHTGQGNTGQCNTSEAFVASNQSLAVRPTNSISPFVRIVGESAPPASFPELELLSAELHSELAFRGGVRLEDSALVARLPAESCGASSACGTSIGQTTSNQNEIADAQPSQEGKIKTMSAQQYSEAGNLSATTWPTVDGQTFNQNSTPLTAHPATASSNFEVGVIVNDFTPYRPMQLAATFIVRDLTTGQEVDRIQRVWRGITHQPEFEETRKEVNKDLRHPVTRQRLEHTALPDISPRHMIKRAATEVADSLYQSLLKPSEAISGQYSSALRESRQPQ